MPNQPQRPPSIVIDSWLTAIFDEWRAGSSNVQTSLPAAFAAYGWAQHEIAFIASAQGSRA
jgi:hypothetical protein